MKPPARPFLIRGVHEDGSSPSQFRPKMIGVNRIEYCETSATTR
ncbi:hypothetical protein SS05631_c10040 [Sinorhizobium sp. CCBAU 05631]|nr:hypothetical protein SS05631_c10040 [Sinorhizobium sp. CCBAU 05631]